MLDKIEIDRVPVVSKNGTPLMPCKVAKARKLIRDKKAIKKWSKLGIFYIQLTFDVAEPNKNQKVILGIDPGSQYDGYCVSTKIVNMTGMAELPSGIVKKLETRRTMRRARRYRNTRQRPKRFDNRNRTGFIAPSQRAKVEFRIRIVKELCKLYPITDFSVEDVRFNHYEKRWGKHFSTVEIGKTLVYEELQKLGELHTFDGYATQEQRKKLGLKKTSKKDIRVPQAHATDAIALCSMVQEINNIKIGSFLVWKRYQNRRRQLHRLEPEQGGIRKRYGGSNSILPFKKNDVVFYKVKGKRKRLMRIGGCMKTTKTNGKYKVSLHEYTLDNKRYTQGAMIENCTRLFNQRIMYE